MKKYIILLLLAFCSVVQAESTHGLLTGIYAEKPKQILPPKENILPKVEPIEASPTPMAEVNRVLDLLQKPDVAFVDFGCGADARWCIAAARKFGCPVIGIEIDPERAARAKASVTEWGLGNQITIIEGDSTKVDVQADVGVAYLYDDTLKKLKPRIEKMKSFASYMHQVPGLTMLKNGNSYIYSRPVATSIRSAVWNGIAYSGPVCNNPNCVMCNAIRAQLSTAPSVTTTSGSSTGYWVKRCNGRQCWFEWVPQ